MPYVRMRTRRQKLIRSWPMYAVIVLITFLVAMSINKCMAHAQGMVITEDTVVDCDLYRLVIKGEPDGSWGKQLVHLGTMSAEFSGKNGYTDVRIRELMTTLVTMKVRVHEDKGYIVPLEEVKCRYTTAERGFSFGITQGMMGRKF